MKAPVRLVDAEQLPPELSLALRSAPRGPNATELQELGGQLGQALGVTLALPRVLTLRALEGSGSAAAGKVAGAAAASTKVSSAVAPLALGAWVVGGLVLGAGLSGLAAHYAGSSDSSAPAVSAMPYSPASAAQPATHTETSRPASTHAERVTAVNPPRQAQSPVGVSTPSETLAPAPQSDQEPELSLLRRAQGSVSSAPAQALSLCALHAIRFGAGVLGQEREVIAIDALLRLGRVSEARARAERFRAGYPGSAHTRRIDAALERQQK
jgi:hypothetical protein